MGKLASKTTAALILKAIRDNEANDLNALERMFPEKGHRCDSVRTVLRELETANLISATGNTYAVTDNWMAIQRVLAISLTELAEVGRPGAMICRPMFGLPDMEHEVPAVFVLMPFTDQLKPIYTTHISRSVNGLGLAIGRADDFFRAHEVVKDVWMAINRSRLLIAECTGRNPNVFYEVGMAHSVGKPVILITQNEEDVPFDLRSIRYIKYAYTPPGMERFEEELAATIRDTLKMDARVTSAF